MALGDGDPSWSDAATRQAHRASEHPVLRSAVVVSGTGASTQSSLPQQVTFDRFELNRILNLYGRMVAIGEWRDYAIDFLKDRAVFSIFRHSSDVPIYRIEKDPRLARKQGAYSAITATGLILRRGHDLDRVLRVLDKSLRVVG